VESAAPSVLKTAAEPVVQLRDVTKQFEGGTQAVRGLDLAIRRGEFVSLLGASGCGKTTVLRLIAGLEKPSAGTIRWHGGAEARPRVSCVFQEATLMPWATALGNVSLPLSLSGRSKAEANERALAALEEVELGPFAQRYPRELSGGMKMRVSLARAIVTEPEILLLDEPFAALDEITRAKLNQDLWQLWRDRGFTTVFVTHSVLESVYLSQRVIVFASRPGRIFAESTIDDRLDRNDAFRIAPDYLRLCAGVSASLREAMA
jgi:NitT/TauT family transport system ATP-binding protein